MQSMNDDKKLRALRILLVLDAAVLFLLGALFVFVPRVAAGAFGFENLSAGVFYMIGLWGCALFTMGFGYAFAATNPLRHEAWIQVAIVRGACEFVLGLFYVFSGIVTWKQAGFGIFIAGAMALAYIALYPRPARVLAPPPEAQTSAP
jgi:hypothetical protein